MTGKYVNIEAIAAKIARDYKELEFDFYDVVEWCVEAENNIAEFEQFVEFRNIPIEVIDKKKCGSYYRHEVIEPVVETHSQSSSYISTTNSSGSSSSSMVIKGTKRPILEDSFVI
jgi:cellobiose-specific phosphotransferase system component IIB